MYTDFMKAFADALKDYMGDTIKTVQVAICFQIHP
jgi:hypothetical protein